jgi:hypothetical protein
MQSSSYCNAPSGGVNPELLFYCYCSSLRQTVKLDPIIVITAGNGRLTPQCNDDDLPAVGALIRSHPNVGSQLGARVTAARSAYLWGDRPIKVSSDGDVAVHFKSRNSGGECDAMTNFL